MDKRELVRAQPRFQEVPKKAPEQFTLLHQKGGLFAKYVLLGRQSNHHLYYY
jgi:hypothetical protein